MKKENANRQNDYYRQASEVLGEEFWQEIGQLLPVSGPRIDMYHSAAAVFVLAELPALARDDSVNIRLEGQTLVLSGELPCMYPVTEDRIVLKERFFGRFERAIALPSPVSESGISARYAKGLLVIELPVLESAKQTNIPIEY